MLVTEFDLPTPEEREERRRELENQIKLAEEGMNKKKDSKKEESAPEEEESKDTSESEDLPSAPDLDFLLGDDSED